MPRLYFYAVASGVFSSAKTRLVVTGAIPSGTSFSTIASGPGYTHNGDLTTLGGSQALFRSTNPIRINVNGVEQDKETAILWVTATSFQLISLALNPTDIITIYN